MKTFMRTMASVLAVLFALSPLVGGMLNQVTFAEGGDSIESPIIPIGPSIPAEKQGLTYIFDDATLTATVTGYDGDEEIVAIPATVADGEVTYTVTAIASAAFSASYTITSVAIPASVTQIGSFAFDACSALQNVWYEGDEAAFAAITVADGNEAFLEAEKHFNACMKSEGPDFVHSYDDHDDADCNACGANREVENFVPGDVDGNDGLDIEDAIYLLFHSYFPERYPVNQSADFDGNGAFDYDDVFYLLYHINFPERYPLH